MARVEVSQNERDIIYHALKEFSERVGKEDGRSEIAQRVDKAAIMRLAIYIREIEE